MKTFYSSDKWSLIWFWISVLKNIPEITEDFNVLTAMPIQDLDTTHIPTDKCQEINKKLEKFYSNQSAVTTAAAMAIGKPFLIDYFTVKTSKILSSFEQLTKFPSHSNSNYFGWNFPQILHDKAFAHPIHRLIMSRNKYQHAPTYLLRFDFESRYSVLKRFCVGEKIPGKP